MVLDGIMGMLVGCRWFAKSVTMAGGRIDGILGGHFVDGSG